MVSVWQSLGEERGSYATPGALLVLRSVSGEGVLNRLADAGAVGVA